MKTAPQFANNLTQLIRGKGETQQRIAVAIGIHPSVISRLCSHGSGPNNRVIEILGYLKLEPYTAYEIIRDRFEELSEGFAEKVWKSSKGRRLVEDDYVSRLAPCEAWRAYACAAHGMSLLKVIELAKSAGIDKMEDISKANPWDFVEFTQKLASEYGEDNAKEVLGKKPRQDHPSIILLDFLKETNAGDHVKLKRGNGKMYFGIPNIVVSHYEFEEDGEIECSPHKYGVEYVYSLKGAFQITYDGHLYPLLLSARGGLYVYDARKKHKIKLVEAEGGEGTLAVVRYCPTMAELRLPRRRRRT